jgi:hypothetical protein
MVMAEKDGELSETDLALIDSLTLLFDLLIGGKDDVAQLIAGLLDARIRHWEQKGKPKTAAVLAMMKRQSTEPALLEQRRQRLSLRDTKGSAD